MTPAEKLKLMRQYEANPSAAILALADALRKEMEVGLAASAAKIKADLSSELGDLARLVEIMKGKDGKDASPEEVATVLMATPAFIKATRAKDGESVIVEDVVAALKSEDPFIEMIKGKPGSPGKDASVADVVTALLANKRFMKTVTGESPQAEDVARTLKSDAAFVNKTKGEKGDDGSPDKPFEIAAKLNTTTESVEQYVIKDLRKWMRGVERAFSAVSKGNKPPRKIGGGGNIIEYYDLTSQCNGSAKTFTIPKCRRVLAVFGTQFPIIYRPGVDWTATQTTVTLTSEVSAPEAGQTLYIHYIH